MRSYRVLFLNGARHVRSFFFLFFVSAAIVQICFSRESLRDEKTRLRQSTRFDYNSLENSGKDSSYMGRKRLKKDVLVLRPLNDDLENYKPLANQDLDREFYPSGVPEQAPLIATENTILEGTTESEMLTLVKGFLGPSAVISERLDLFPKHTSYFDGSFETIIRLTRTNSGTKVEGRGPINAIRCTAIGVQQPLGGSVAKWCQRHINWISIVTPAIVDEVMNSPEVLWKARLQSEVSCDSVQSEKYLDSAIRATETIWGRFTSFGNSLLPTKMYSMLSSWSRVIIVQSAKMDETSHFAARYYITKYLLSDPLGAAVVPHFGPLKCHIRPFLQGATRLTGFDVVWPKIANMGSKEWNFIPTCLAIYPIGSLLSYDDLKQISDTDIPWRHAKRKRQMFACSEEGFVALEGIPAPQGTRVFARTVAITNNNNNPTVIPIIQQQQHNPIIQ